MAGKKAGTTIIIRKEEVVEGGHHGGAWKVAYADFVTAMMAFFLLMWLLNATTEQQKRGIADYFSPNPATPQGSSGAGLMFSGRTPNVDGSLASDRGAVELAPTTSPITTTEDEGDDLAPTIPQERKMAGDAELRGGADRPERAGRQVADTPPVAVGEAAATGEKPNPASAAAPPPDEKRAPTDRELQAELEKRERAAFERAAQQIRDAVRADPALADLARQLTIDITPDGLRVQVVDEDKRPMFATGSSALSERARALLLKVAPILMKLPEGVSITGHTDGAPYKGGDRSNWDLSAERANATRRLLVDAGLPEARLRSVAGMADRDPLTPQDRLAAVNRRIAILVLRDVPAARPAAAAPAPPDGPAPPAVPGAR